MEKFVDFSECGRGAYSVVYRAIEREANDHDKPVAIKVFHNASPEITKSALREARFLSECSHTNIVQLKEALQSGSGRVYLVLSFAPHVLSQQIKSHQRGLPPVAIRSIIFQLLAALQHLHSKGIMHRDIKPANCLITDDGVLKLCDFGFARHVEGYEPVGQESTLTPYVTTRWYRAPEVLVGQEYGTAVDIWAVGCIFAEMLTGRALFPGTSAVHQLSLQHNGVGLTQQQLTAFEAQTSGGAICKSEAGAQSVFDSLASFLTPTMTQFLKACLHADPAQRATADQLLKTAFVKEGAWDVPTPEKPRHSKQRSRRVRVPQESEALRSKQHSKESVSLRHGNVEQTSGHSPDDLTHADEHLATTHQSDDQNRSSAQSSSGSRNMQRVIPTVRQRTAQQVAEAAGFDDDAGGDHPAVQKRLQLLPPGEPLSDLESEDESPPVAPASPAVRQAVHFQLPAGNSGEQDASRSIQSGGGDSIKKLHTSFAAQRKGKGALVQALSSVGASSAAVRQVGLSAERMSGGRHQRDVAATAEGDTSSNRLSGYDSAVGVKDADPDAVVSVQPISALQADAGVEAVNSPADRGMKPGKHVAMSALHRSVAMPCSISSNSLLGPRNSRQCDSHMSVFAHKTQTEPTTTQEGVTPSTAQMAAAAITRATTETAPVTGRGWMSCRSDGRLLRPSDLLECPPPPCAAGTDSQIVTSSKSDIALLPTMSVQVESSVTSSKSASHEPLKNKEQSLKAGYNDEDVRMSSPLRAGIMAWNRNSGLGTRLSTPQPPRTALCTSGRLVTLQHDHSGVEAQGTQRQSPMAVRASRRLQLGTPQLSCNSAPGTQLSGDAPCSPAAAPSSIVTDGQT